MNNVSHFTQDALLTYKKKIHLSLNVSLILKHDKDKIEL